MRTITRIISGEFPAQFGEFPPIQKPRFAASMRKRTAQGYGGKAFLENLMGWGSLSLD